MLLFVAIISVYLQYKDFKKCSNVPLSPLLGTYSIEPVCKEPPINIIIITDLIILLGICRETNTYPKLSV
jgi:hypothetical protein